MFEYLTLVVGKGTKCVMGFSVEMITQAASFLFRQNISKVMIPVSGNGNF